jgi:cytochrome c oxidase subunit II
MNRHVVSIIVIWLILTAIGEALVFAPGLFPTVGSEEAQDFDDIFRFLLILGVPVFTFVITMIGYSMIQWRQKGEPDEDGPVHRGQGLIPKVWILVTGTLAVFVMIHPGLTGLAKLQAEGTGMGWGDPDAEMTVDVLAFQFSWTFTYVDYGVTVDIQRGGELVLPIHRSTKFNVNSSDVVHSYWIPAFRLKIDAIPGRTTFFTVEPDVEGDYATDDAYRVQCAELCGVDHGAMYFPVRVVPEDEFERWISNLQEAQR